MRVFWSRPIYSGVVSILNVSVNVVINYDFPDDSDQFLHRVGRAGRFGTKGIAISFVSAEADEEILEKVRSRFEVNIPELPDEIDMSSYMTT